MRSYHNFGLLMALSAICFAPPDADTGTAVADAPAKGPSKSIVPNKYGDKYKNGGSDVLADFIKAQCTGKDGFEFSAFFVLCRANKLPEDKVAHYEAEIAAKKHGAEGRTRMTLRNMLAAIARKNGELVGIDGTTVTKLDLPKPATTGAAKAAQTKAAETQTTGGTPTPEPTTGHDAPEDEDDGTDDEGDEPDEDDEPGE